MKAEDIVRALAARDEPTDPDGHFGCVLCDTYELAAAQELVHKPDCPWRLAREWVVLARNCARVVVNVSIEDPGHAYDLGIHS